MAGGAVTAPSAEVVREAGLAPVQADPLLSLVDRLAHDPSIDVGKLEKILDLQRGLRADQAKAEYQMAFAAMSERLPVITKRGEITNKAGAVQSRFAKYEDIQRVIKPILREFGFTLNHEQSPETASEMVLTTHLIHRGGHAQQSTFRAKADESGSKNHVQGLGSISSYAKRYNVSALLDLETQDEDNDGQGDGPTAPAGFDAWMATIDKLVRDGCDTTQLLAAWECSDLVFKKHITETNLAQVNAWKATAAKVKKGAK